VGKPLDDGQRQALIFAPLWVYTAVAGADGPPEPSQFKRFLEELDTAEARVAGSPDARAAVASLRSNIDVAFEAFQADGDDPRRGLKRVKGVAKRLPADEAGALMRWLMDLAVRVGGARHLAGEAHISDGEAQAIRDVAGWLGVDPPDLSATAE
jgi:hypothetical protein